MIRTVAKLNMAASLDSDAMGERAKRIPPWPRAVLNGMVLLPVCDEEWMPVKDLWAMPGCAASTTDELRALARSRGWEFSIKNGGSK